MKRIFPALMGTLLIAVSCQRVDSPSTLSDATVFSENVQMLTAASLDGTISSYAFKDKNGRVKFEPGISGFYAQTSEEFPTFSGFTKNSNNNITVYTTNNGQNKKLARFLEENKWYSPNVNGDITFKTVKNNYRSLLKMKTLVKSLKDLNLISTGIDISGNIVDVTVQDDAEASKLREILIKAKVDQLINIEIGEIATGLNLGLSGTLNTRQPSVITGGVNVAGGPGTCTIGYNVTVQDYNSNTLKGFITNSHCSRNMFSNQNDVAYHFSTLNQIGVEQVDPISFTNQEYPYGCPVGTLRCRWSDASFFQYTGNGLNYNTPIGYVARTTYSSNGSAGSEQIDVNNDNIYLVPNYVSAGMNIEKIGRASGWTTGTVINTCEDVRIDVTNDGIGDYWILCSIKANLYAIKGDSGSPVFSSSGSSYGLLFAGNSNGITYISSFDNINYDFGDAGYYLYDY